ncbi:centromere protein O-like [Lithobates pipiens]
MEEVQNLFREGVMSHLDRLEALSQNLAHKQEEKRQRETDLQEKRDLIVRLQKERGELRSQIQLQKEMIQALSARQEGSKPQVQSTQSAVQDLRLEEMKNIMEALWFTGIDSPPLLNVDIMEALWFTGTASIPFTDSNHHRDSGSLVQTLLLY